MIKTRKINNVVVNPIKLNKIDTHKIKGHKLFEEIYSNIFLCAKKKSGKTNVINKIINECKGRDSKITIFCSTVNKDNNWRHIVKTLKKKGFTVVTFTSMKEDKEDLLAQLIEMLQNEYPEDSDEEMEEEEQEKPKKIKYITCDENYEMEITKKRKEKFICPEHIIIFDDISNELKNPNIIKLLKTNRHYKMKVIISSQYLHDLLPESRAQLDYCILFKGQPDKKLEIIHKDLDLSIDIDEFLELYEKATKNKFNFLYIDVNNEQFRKNFNEILEYE